MPKIFDGPCVNFGRSNSNRLSIFHTALFSEQTKILEGGAAKFSPSSNKGPVVSPKLLMLKSLNMVGASRHLPIYGRTKVCNHGLELVNF